MYRGWKFERSECRTSRVETPSVGLPNDMVWVLNVLRLMELGTV